MSVRRDSKTDIAVVGLSCRLPGASGPQEFWRLLRDAESASGDTPPDRAVPQPPRGLDLPTRGGFIEDADLFDAGFFGISPREAEELDPQQRLLLELAWEALEHSGTVPGRLSGTDAGVFVGAMAGDYAELVAQGDLRDIDKYAMTGTARGLLANRLSYFFGFHGPSLSVDTAQSSSLVAVHLACESLRKGESTLALAGGVQLNLTPSGAVAMHELGALSPDARCYVFDERANGTVRGEGGALVVLKTLDQALADGDTVHAVIRGSAVNSDGATDGLATPSAAAQQAVIRGACVQARVDPEHVQYVELHGTGTAVGDPIEAAALAAVFGPDRDAGSPLLVGSVKTNLGHLGGAAGIAGLLKVVLALKERTIPASLHFVRANPRIPLRDWHLDVAASTRDWPSPERRLLAGVSSFGMGGTNVHMIVEESPAAAARPAVRTAGSGERELPVVPWVLSAKSAGALSGQARKLADFAAGLEGARRAALDVGWSLVSGRSVFDHRAVVLAGTGEGLVEGLQSLVSGVEHPGVVVGAGAEPLGGRVLVFGGQGSQWLGMGRELLGSSPVFAASISEVEEAFEGLVGWSLTDTLRGSGPGVGDVGRVDVVQPVLFAVMVSLARLWKWMGVEPDAVVGHSQGEIAAACVAGALSLQDAARVVVLRSQVLAGVAGRGGMAAVSAPVEQVGDWLTGWDGRLEIAAVNGPSSVVVSGDAEPVAEFVDWCEQQGTRARRLAVDYASHCSQMEPLREPILDALGDVQARSVSTAFYSTVTGGRIDTAELDAAYWFENLRRRVRFEDASRALLADGFRAFIEATPHPSLVTSIHDTAEESDSGPVVAVGSLRRDRGGLDQFLTSVAQAFVAGVEVDWAQVFEETGASWTDLPTYAFDRRRYWTNKRSLQDVTGVGLASVEHPLLGAAVELPDGGGVVLTGRLSMGESAWLADHVVLGHVLFPGTGFVEAAIRAGDQVGAGHVRELTLHAPLPLSPEQATQLHVMVTPAPQDGDAAAAGEGLGSASDQRPDAEGREWRVAIYSRPDGRPDHAWTLHADGVLSGGGIGAENQWDTAWPPEGAAAVDLTDAYDRLAARGHAYGPGFQGLAGVWRRGSEVYVEAALPEALRDEASRFGLHPVLLDAVLQAGLVTDVLGEGTVLPHQWHGLALHACGAATVRARLAPHGPDGLSVTIIDPAGQLVLTADSLVTRPIDPASLSDAFSGSGALYHLEWIPAERSSAAELAEDVVALSLAETGIDGELPDGPATVLLRCRTAVASDDEPALEDLVCEVLSVVQQWLARADEDARLIVVTSGAVGWEQDEVRDLAGAAVWGLVRSAQSENPGRIVLVDVPDWETPDSAVLEVASLDEPQCALRDDQVWVPRLRRSSETDSADGVTAVADTLLITGGTGRRGALAARHAVQRWGARDLVLASPRDTADDAIGELVTELEQLGAQVRVVTCDVADRSAVAELVAGIRAGGGRVSGVVHAADDPEDAEASGATPDRVRAVLAAKARGAWNLHLETLPDEPSLFVMFSSVAGILGSMGQADHAAADAFLDALAWHRRASGLPAVSLVWGADGTDQARPRQDSPPLLTADRGLELLDAALATGRPVSVLAQVDIAYLQASPTVPRLLADLVAVRRTAASQGNFGRRGLQEQLAAVKPDRRLQMVLDLVRAHAAAGLGHAASGDIDPGQTFRDLGFDSLGAVEFRNRLSAAAGVRLPSTVTFDYPTPSLMAQFLLAELVDGFAADASTVAGRPVADADEPVAIVGMSCRFPGGVVSPEGLWDLVAKGRDVISEFPENRGWDVAGIFDPEPGVPGKSYTRRGGFLDGAGEFDAGFFGISPREAVGMDPQQRLLLEAVWEAFERAGIDPAGLRGSSTGVFAGLMAQDYGDGVGGTEADGYGLTGSTTSVASGRVSYVLGLEGPAVTVDTACSSSLVALHLACQSVRSGESELAVAGGVTVMASPGMFVEFSRQRGLAPDGRCKSFGEGADGTAWAEGVGVVVVERLSEARRLGHRVLAVVRGSAINQDGASNGLTAPNGPSQQRVIRQALANAGLGVTDVDVVEAHGTGTSLGDPIEAQALLATYGQRPVDGPPLWLGSLKSNLGHAQAAAGIAGVIKMVQALHHDTLPATLHADEPSSHVDWDAGRVRLLTEAQSWPADHVRRAAVSSFGISGTNAHVILEQPPATRPVDAGGLEMPVVPWILSAKSQRALSGQARRLLDYAAERGLDTADGTAALADVGWSLVSGRSVFDHRAVVLAGAGEGLVEGLQSLVSGAEHPGVVTGSGAGSLGGRVLVFGGQGSQWLGMGRELLESSPVFAASISECEEAFGGLVDWFLTETLRGSGPRAGDLNRVDVVQPVLFAVMVSLARLWKWIGVEPDAVVGHSQGEIAAACVAGALSLQDAARVVVLRSQVLAEVAGRGGMAAVSASVEQVTDWLTRWDGWLEVAAVNGPSSVVVSGDADPVAEFVDWCEGDGVRARRLAVDYASHCSQMEPLREPILDALQGISPQSVSTAFYSTVTGGRIDTVELDGAYWFENLRRQVRFDDASRALLADGFRVFIEATPHPSLVTSIHDTAEASDSGPVVAVGSLRRDRGGLDQFLTSVAQAFVAGVEVDWKQIFEGTGAAWTDLPTYAFDHRHYWLNGRSGHDVSGVGQSAVEHPLLGAAVELPDGGGVVLTGRLSTGVDTWLADHAVHGQVIFPGTGFVEATIRAGDQVGASHLRELTLHNPLLLTKEHATRLHVMLTPLSQGQHGAASTGGEWRAAIYSRPDGGEDHPWILHAEGVLGTEPGDAGAPVTSDAWTAWPPVDADPVDLSQAYEGLAEQGYEYGPVFQGLAGVWRRGSEVFVEAALPERARNEASRFGLHPALLDAVLHAALLTDVIEGPDADGRIALPYCWNQVALHASGAATVRARLAPEGPDGLSVTVVDPSGQPVLTADSLLTRPIDPARLRQAPSAADWLYHLAWTPAGTDAPADDGRADEGDELLTLVVSGTDSATDLPERPPATMLVHCRPSSSLKPDEVADSAETIVCQVLGVLQWWLARSDEDARLIVVTSGAVGWEQDEVRDLAGAAVWGLVRSAQSENPGRITLLDVPDWDTPIPALVTAGMPGESQYVVRDEQLWIPRLQRPNTGDLVTPEDGAHDATPTIDSGSLVITGGTGGLGVVVARHAVERWGVRDVVLVSRRGPEAEGIEEVLAELRSLGAQARAVACDVSDRDAVRELVGGIRAGGGRVAGVVHAAGVLHDGVVETLPADRVQVVLAAKARAAWNLHQETLDDEPGLFVMFSSVAGVLGLAGQAGYAAANTFLDALAWHRRAQGLPATSLAWGLWASPSGMTSHLDTTDQARLQRNGVLPLPTAQGLELLDIGVRAERPVLVPARLDLASFSGAAAMPPMLAGLVRSRRAVASQTEGASGDSLRTRLAGLDADRRLPVVLDLVRAHAAAVLGHAAGVEIDPGQAFRDLGFDSLGAVEFRNRLSAAAGVRLPSTMTFDYPTPELLARFLLAQVVDDAPASAEATPLTGRSSAQDDEPVAIVGMSCRFPGGVVSPEGLWDLVAEGRDVISEFPDDRGWDVAGIFDPEPGVPGKSYTRWGGFLEAAGEFDAGFFGISPREAMGMDPQQRLLLEAVWEAFERAGIDPAGLRGTSTGVFAGLMAQEYGVGIGGTEVDGYGLTGSTASVASGRVSYVLGLEGPAVTIDTACSSSLVALHLACQSVRSGESELAVAGGVTVMASSEMFVEFSRQRGLAPDGRCKSFGEGADGTAWAEGVGVVVVERLSEARRLGHRVLAVVRGSAVNQDGASNGLTAPNGPSQQRVIRQALANSGLGIEDVDVVEAHGTGTSLGDPIEAQALLATYGQRPADGPPLWLGSLKSNMGHAQAAAGVAGVIKMVQALHHDTLPATLHADEPSSHVDWDAGHVRLLTEAQPWPADHVRRAAVSSFGISGTNAHVIIEQPPSITTVVQETPGTKLPVLPWVLSAKSPRALSGQARNLLDHAAGRGMEASDGAARALVDVGWSLVSGRSVFDHRAVVLGEDGQELLAGLRSVAEKPADELAGPVVSGVARAGRSVVVFPGQGSQWLGMGRGLYEAYGVFAEAFDQVISELESCLKDDIAPGALREVVWGEDADLLNQTLFTQAGLFAVEVALFRLVEAWGLRPDFVLGHSVGEIAAAHVAGVLSLADAARLVAARGRLMQALPTGGAMAAVQADEAQVTEFLTAHGLADVGIAAVNAPGSIVVSGAADQIERMVEWCKGEGGKATRLQVSHAFHSPLMDPMLAQFREVAESVTPRPAEIALVSNLTGTLADDDYGTPDYWVRHVRQPVRFADSIAFLHTQGATRFLELGPGTALTSLITQTPPTAVPTALATNSADMPSESETWESDQAGGESAPEADGLRAVVEPAVVPVLRKGQDEPRSLMTGLAQAFVAGVEVDWKHVFDGTGATWTDLPTYAFDHRHYWVSSRTGQDVSGAGLSAVSHPLLAAAVELPGEGGTALTGRLALGVDTWLADHAVLGRILFPGTGFVEAAIRAGDQVGCGELRELTLHAPLPLVPAQAVQLHVMLTPSTGDSTPSDIDSRDWRVAIYSRPEDQSDQPWTLHAEGTLGSRPAAADAGGWAAGSWPPVGAEAVDTEDAYGSLADQGYEYGPVFQGLAGVWRRGSEVFVEAALPERARSEASRFGLHPALLDSVLHAALLTDVIEGSGAEGRVALPYSWNHVALHATGAATVRARLVSQGPDELGIEVVDAAGQPVLTAGSLLTRQIDPARLRQVSSSADWLYHLAWTQMELAAADAVSEMLEAGAGPSDDLGDEVALVTVDRDGSVSSLPESAPTNLLLFCRPDIPSGTGPGEGASVEMAQGLPGVVDGLVCGALQVVQWWLERASRGRLVVVTRGGVAWEPGGVSDLAAAAVWGLVRSAHSENPDRIVLVDVPDWNVPSRAVLEAAGLGEPQVALHEGQVWVPRLEKASETDLLPIPATGPLLLPSSVGGELKGESDGWALGVVDGGGSLDGVGLVAGEGSGELAAGEVRVAVAAVGLNFRDVLMALGMYPGSEVRIGGEGSGVVVETGPGVHNVSVGDRVMGLFRGGIGPVSVTDHRLLVRVPAGLGLVEAAGVPVVFATAFYGLRDLGGLSAGETVLVHAASGGVGCAAVQLARAWGARVLGTASRGKWEFLRGQGFAAEEVADSRSTSFEGDFLRLTGGAGVDVVLDCLAGEFVDASLRLLPRGGRFLEMGKTDIRDADQIAEQYPGVWYRAFDLMDADPDRLQEILTEIAGLLERGEVRPAPVSVWGVGEARRAFRFFSQARHIGKIVLTFPPVMPPGSLVITGGTGGLGVVVARHAVERWGVRDVVLVSRRGPKAEGIEEVLAELRNLGAQARAVACDVSDRDAVRELVTGIRAEGGRVAGVVHAAGVLDDGVVTGLTPERVRRVLAAKAQAAWNLHVETLEDEPGLFVMFSSIAGVLGSAGQASYAAANTFLDVLARHRRAQGLPATSLAWGLWASPSGMTSHLADSDQARLQRGGLLPLTTDQGLQLLDAALASTDPAPVPARIDTAALRADTAPPMLAGLAPTRRAVASQVVESQGGLQSRLAGLASEQQLAVILDLIRAHAAAILGHGNSRDIHPQQAFQELGFDSLGAVEFRNRLSTAAGVRLPSSITYDYPTPQVLAAHIHADITGGADENGSTAGHSAKSVFDNLESLLSIATADEAERKRLVTRLRAIVTKWDSKPDAHPDSNIDIESAEEDELFSIIDREAGYDFRTN